MRDLSPSCNFKDQNGDSLTQYIHNGMKENKEKGYMEEMVYLISYRGKAGRLRQILLLSIRGVGFNLTWLRTTLCTILQQI